MGVEAAPEEGSDRRRARSVIRAASIGLPLAGLVPYAEQMTVGYLDCWGKHGVVTADFGTATARSPTEVFDEEFFDIARIPEEARQITTDMTLYQGVFWLDRTDPGHTFLVVIEGRAVREIRVDRAPNGRYLYAGELTC